MKTGFASALPCFLVAIAALLSALPDLRAESALSSRRAEALEVAKASGAAAGFSHALAGTSGGDSKAARSARLRELVALALSLQEQSALGMADEAGQWILDWLRTERKAFPEEASLPYFEGLVLERSGELDGAEKAYARALELNPGRVAAAALERLAAERAKELQTLVDAQAMRELAAEERRLGLRD